MKNKLILILLLAFPLSPLMAQEEEEQKVRDIISFLEYMLNTLGDPQTSARDKDVIVNESYAKIFRDATVQVEDDLDENRDVITNKDVQAYLKDVNFFFKKAHFDMEWKDMEVSENEAGETFYKVSLLRNLEAVSVMGDTINQTIDRFVEINLNPESQDLRIASIYTNELNQDDVWMDWWQNLSLEWQAIFKRKTSSIDDLELDQIKRLSSIEELDLEGNRFILDIEPLSRITGLKHLNISHTQITDVSPIRNLNKLEFLDISHTGVATIEALKYARELRVFHIDQTPVSNIEVIARMPSLTELTMNGTFVTDFSPLAGLPALKHLSLAYTEWHDEAILDGLPALEYLDASGTSISGASGFSGAENLKELYADSTNITDLDGLSGLAALQTLSVNHTKVNNLAPLASLPELQRLYCDYTGVTLAEARAFMEENPRVLIVFESEELLSWWEGLPGAWKDIFTSYVTVSEPARKEELARIVRIDSLDLSSNQEIRSLEPLQRLLDLSYLNIQQTAISELGPVSELRALKFIDFSSTMVSDLKPLSDLLSLEQIDASYTEADSLGLVRALPSLVLLNIDATRVQDTAAMNMARMRPETLIIYKTERLESWWSQLSEEWKTIFRSEAKLEENPDSRALHRLISLQKLNVSDAGVYDIHPLKEFIRLKELRVSGTSVRNLSPLSFLDGLEVLDISRNPLEDVSALRSLNRLSELNISNTPIDNLEILGNLFRLEYLDCSGTQIKRLDGLERLGLLEYLDCSNTLIKRLDPVTRLALKTLKCYNTKISSRRIDEFKQLNPECDVSFY